MNKKTISSLQNPEVKTLVRLRRSKVRQDLKLMLIDGIRPLTKALESRIVVTALYYIEETADQKLIDLARSKGVNLQPVTEKVFDKIGYGDNPDGHLGLAPQPGLKLSEVPGPPNSLYIVLEGLEKPGNLGAVLRSADAAGASGVIMCSPRTDVYNPNVIRNSQGAVFTVPIALASCNQAIKWLNHNRIQILAASPAGGRIYTDIDFTLSTAIIIGSEHRGLSEIWKKNMFITIPMKGRVDSLNAAQTATILMFEVLRQRRNGR